MKTIGTRLQKLEQASTNKAPLLIYVPDGMPTPKQQAEIDQAKRDRRPVFLV